MLVFLKRLNHLTQSSTFLLVLSLLGLMLLVSLIETQIVAETIFHGNDFDPWTVRLIWYCIKTILSVCRWMFIYTWLHRCITQGSQYCFRWLMVWYIQPWKKIYRSEDVELQRNQFNQHRKFNDEESNDKDSLLTFGLWWHTNAKTDNSSC